MLRGIVRSAYTVAGRGAYVAVEMLSGPANAGSKVELPLRDGSSRIVDVAGVELLQHEGPRATVALRIVDLDPEDILVGALAREISD